MDVCLDNLVKMTASPADNTTESPRVSLVYPQDSTKPSECIIKDSVCDSSTTVVRERHHDFVKSAADKREYRGLLLANRLKVLLVSDPATDDAAAALEVQVGNYSDPDEIPGLAHFCEHMLFLGTKKYPEENEFSKFLSEHGGYNNAYTTSDTTLYYFCIRPLHLVKALDIFAQFFISPLFTESATDRELNAVHSEFETYVSSDDWRLNEVKRSVCDPRHPFSKFSIGNKETLKTIPESKDINVRKELLKFHNEWYSANIMSLVVVGKESLNELEASVAPLFSSIEDKSVTALSWPEHPFPPELCQKKIYKIPIKDVRTLNITFSIPYVKMYYKSQPTFYLTHLIHHEGPGSLLSALKKRGWCNSCVSYSTASARGFSTFHIDVDLTEEGMNHLDDIMTLIFQYLALLKSKGPQQWVWEELKNTAEVNFRFEDSDDPINLVQNHVQFLQEFPMEDILSIQSLISEWNPELITEILSLLTPENVIIYVVAQAFEAKCTITIPYYGTKYCVENIDEAVLKEWKEVQLNEELHLPPPNDFIPSNLELDTSDDATCEDIAPAVIKDTKLMRLWYKRDNEFLLPKAMITFDLVSPLVFSDPLNANLSKIWLELLADSLREITYAAALVGLSFWMTPNEYGFNLTVCGYDDKIDVLLEIIVKNLVSFKADPKRFDIIVENRIREIKNLDADQPGDLAVSGENLCRSSVSWPSLHDLEVLQDVTPKQLEDFAANFIRKVHIEVLMHGNLSRERAMKIAALVENQFPKDGTPLFAEQLLLNRDIQLDHGSWYIRSICTSVHRSSCVTVYYGCGENEPRHNVLLSLLANLLDEPLFNTLRTQEQLGYTVYTNRIISDGCQGLRVIIQGDQDPEFLDQRIEAFIHEFLKHLENMNDEEFSKHKEAVLLRILEKPKQMINKAYQLWSEIINQVYNFDRARIEEKQLSSINKEELISYYKKHFSADSPERQKLSVYVKSTAEGGAGNENTKKAEQRDDDEKCLDKIENKIDAMYSDSEEKRESGELKSKKLHSQNLKDKLELETYQKEIKVKDLQIEELKIKEEKDQNVEVVDKQTDANKAVAIDCKENISKVINEEKQDKMLTNKTDKKPELITNLIEFRSRRKLYPNSILFTDIPRKGLHI